MRLALLFLIPFLLPIQLVSAQPLWNLSIGDVVVSVSISSDGNYVAASSLYVGVGVGRICFLNKEGELIWSYLAEIPISTSTSSRGEYIALGIGWEGIFYLSREGELIWSYKTKESFLEVHISSDGNYVACSTSHGNVYYFNGEGRKLWSYRFLNRFIPISMPSDGSLVVVGSSYEVMLLSRLGDILWSSEIDGEVYRIKISSDGSHIVALTDDKLYFLSGQGEILWTSEIEGEILSMILSSDGSYVAVSNIFREDNEIKGKVLFYNEYGKLLWSHDTETWASVSMSSDGNYVVVGGKEIYLLNKDGKLLWSHLIGDGSIHVISLSNDGRYAAIGVNGNLILFSFEEIIRENPPKMEPMKTVSDKFLALTSLAVVLSILGVIFLALVRKISFV